MATGNVVAVGRTKVLVMGHSYVHWLERFAADQDKMPGAGSRTLKFHDCDVAYMGVRGATVDSLRTQAVLREVRRTSPDVVILHVGGNDIDAKSRLSPQLIGMRLYEMARDMIKHAGVLRVIVCQVVRRNRWRHLSYDEGAGRVSDINEFLLAVCDGEKGVSFWKHRGLWQAGSDIFRKDGVHLNDLGNRKLLKSIRGAILLAIRMGRH